MPRKIPVIAVLGRKRSGKTTVIELLVPQLIKRGFSIATAKHIAHEGFSIDSAGSDTWRHSSAGANPVMAVSSNETSVIFKTKTARMEVIFHMAQKSGVNVLVLEGFSSAVMDDKSVGKIICVRSLKEYEEYKRSVKGDVIAFCSFQTLGKPILKIGEDLPVLIERTIKFIEKRNKIQEILKDLAGLNCGKCGRKTCEELAEEIYLGKASIDECFPMKIKPKLRARLTLDGREIPLQPFTSEFIRKTVLGMISSLKNVSIEGDEEIRIDVIKHKE